MESMAFQVVCGCGCPGVLMDVKNADLEAWRKVANAGQIAGLQCATCGCPHDLADGGTSILTTQVAKPKINLLSVSGGPAAGGTPVTIAGHALAIGTLVVRFGGIPALNMRARSSASVTVDSPPGKFHLMTAGSMLGTLMPGDQITGVGSGKTATIVEAHVDQGYLLVSLPSGPFSNGEVVQRSVGNSVTLAAIAQPLVVVGVDVSVENEHGQRHTGGVLAGSFTYTTP